MNRAGFSLIEMSLYAALVSVLAIISISWMNTYINSLNRAYTKSSQVLAVHTALHRLAEDIQMAEATQNTWTHQQNVLKFYVGQKIVSWHQEKDKLYRMEGSAKALIVNHLHSFMCGLDIQNNRVKNVECRMVTGDYSAKRSMRVYNG